MIDIEDYLLIQRNDGTLYKMPIGGLSAVTVINNPDYSKIEELELAIDEAKEYLIQLSTEFIETHYSIEELNDVAEQKVDTEKMPLISSLMKIEKIETQIANSGLVTKDQLDEAYEKEIDTIETEFDKASSEVGNWMV